MLQRLIEHSNTMVSFVRVPQTSQNSRRRGHVRFRHLDSLQSPLKSSVPFNVLHVLAIGSSADAPQLAPRESGLEQVRGVRGALPARANEHVHLVDEKDRRRVPFEFAGR